MIPGVEVCGGVPGKGGGWTRSGARTLRARVPGGVSRRILGRVAGGHRGQGPSRVPD